jgi:hypothetical protein
MIKTPHTSRSTASRASLQTYYTHFSSKPLNIRVTAQYTIRTQPNDPLIAKVRRGEFGGKALARYFAGAPEPWSYGAPHLDSSTAASSAEITVGTSKWAVPLGSRIPVQDSRSKVLDSLTVTARGLRLDRIYGIAPQVQNTAQAVWAPGPLGKVAVVLGTAGLSTPDTTRWRLWSFIQQPIFWHLAHSLPWLVLLLAALRAPGADARRFRIAGSCYIAAVALLATLLLHYLHGTGTMGACFGLVFFVAPWFALWWLRERPLPRPAAASALAVPLTAVLLAVSPAPALAIAAATAGAAGMAWLLLRSLATALPLAAFVPAAAGTFLNQQLEQEGNGLVYVACGLLLAPMAIGLVERAAPRRRLLWSALAVAAGVLCMLPYGMLSSLGGQIGFGQEPWVMVMRPEVVRGHTAVITLDFVLIGVLVLLLARRSGTAAALGDPLVRGAAFALPLLMGAPAIWGRVIVPAAPTLILLAGLVWTIPASRTVRAIGLAEVSRRRHAEQMRHEVWTRLRKKVAVAIQRTAPAKLAQGSAELGQVQALWQAIDTSPPPQPDAITDAERALGSSGGYTPRQNAAFGLLAATVLALPLMLYGSWSTLTTVASNPLVPGMTVAGIASWVLAIFRWPIYGALYGLFYTQLRGRSPITKSCALFTAVLVPELLRTLITPSSAPLYAVLVAASMPLSQVVFLAIGLGLIWERRLALAAGLQWRQLRDFRTIGALAPAATALALAVATTLVNVSVGETARALLHPRLELR